nr:hypothetical protein [uncultured Eisenbergiella sp.]
MTNFTMFFNSFLSYLLLFVLVAVLAVIACFIGISLRKKKDARDAAMSQGETREGQS